MRYDPKLARVRGYLNVTGRSAFCAASGVDWWGGLEDGTLKAMKEWREVMEDSRWSGMLSRFSITLLRARSYCWYF